MTDDEKNYKIERRRGPSTSTLSLGGIIAIASLLASGVATYNALQNDIVNLKCGELNQVRTNERLNEDVKAVRHERTEMMKDLNEKLDRLVEQRLQGRK
jgi:cell division protein FtsB